MQRERTTIKLEEGSVAALWLTPAAAAPGPTLVFLHEGLGCIGMWRDLPERLCARLRLPGFAYDRLGHGASGPAPRPRTARYLHEEALTVLPAVLAAAGIERPVLIGHSDGGSIALLHAAAFPDRARAVVAIAAHAFVEEVALTGIRDAVRQYRDGDLRPRLARWHGDKAEPLFRAWSGTWLSPWFRDWNIEPELRTLRFPLLAIQGAADQYATEAHLDAVAGGTADRHLLPGLGHSPHLEARELVVDVIAGFLGRTP